MMCTRKQGGKQSNTQVLEVNKAPTYILMNGFACLYYSANYTIFRCVFSVIVFKRMKLVRSIMMKNASAITIILLKSKTFLLLYA